MSCIVGQVVMRLEGQDSDGNWTYNIDTTVTRDGDDRIKGTEIDTWREQRIVSKAKGAPGRLREGGQGPRRQDHVPTTLIFADDGGAGRGWLAGYSNRE